MYEEAIRKVIIGEINSLTSELSSLANQQKRIEEAFERMRGNSSYCDGFVKKQISNYTKQKDDLDARINIVSIELDILRNPTDFRHIQKKELLEKDMIKKRFENEEKRKLDHESNLKLIEKRREDKEKHKKEMEEKRECIRKRKEELDRIRRESTRGRGRVGENNRGGRGGFRGGRGGGDNNNRGGFRGENDRGDNNNRGGFRGDNNRGRGGFRGDNNNRGGRGGFRGGRGGENNRGSR